MKTKTMKILVTIATILLVVLIGTSTVYGSVVPKDFENARNTSTTVETSIKPMANQIMSIINVIGVVVAVIVLMVIGIKYMIGSAEQKAEYKKTFVPYIVGAVLLASAATIANVIFQFAWNFK